LQLLYTQGLIWVVLFTLSGLPSVAFIVLDLNDAMNMMFVAPQIMTMTICASRMYLGLVEGTEPSITSTGLAGSKQQPAARGSEMQVRFPTPQQRTYLTEGTYSTWGESSVRMP